MQSTMRRLPVLILAAAISFQSGLSQANPFLIEFEGTLDFLSSRLESSFGIGNGFRGSLIYDPDEAAGEIFAPVQNADELGLFTGLVQDFQVSIDLNGGGSFDASANRNVPGELLIVNNETLMGFDPDLGFIPVGKRDNLRLAVNDLAFDPNNNFLPFPPTGFDVSGSIEGLDSAFLAVQSTEVILDPDATPLLIDQAFIPSPHEILAFLKDFTFFFIDPEVEDPFQSSFLFQGQGEITRVTTTAVPAPATALLLGLGLCFAGLVRRRLYGDPARI